MPKISIIAGAVVEGEKPIKGARITIPEDNANAEYVRIQFDAMVYDIIKSLRKEGYITPAFNHGLE